MRNFFRAGTANDSVDQIIHHLANVVLFLFIALCWQPSAFGRPEAGRARWTKQAPIPTWFSLQGVAVLSGTPNTGAQPAPITDPATVQEALKASFVTLQEAIAGLSDDDLNTPVTLFGRDMTKLGALRLILGDQHEHLGQSIAYARSNGVVPPWSK